MAKGELLRVLVVLLFTISVLSMSFKGLVFAQSFGNTNNELLQQLENTTLTYEQLNWAKNMRNQGQVVAKNTIMQKLNELDVASNDKELDMSEIRSNGTILKVFVSSSMPLNLLKAYYKQAAKYDGTLILKGLPGGSFKELAKLVTSISKDIESETGMQIDDEAFERFGVNSVPAIVLIKEEDCFGQQSCKVTYDKVTGSIGVKAALEKFTSTGDLSGEASTLLEK